jgi:integral membrane protein (TIGR00529 family)
VEALKLVLIFVAIVVALRRRIPVGVTLLGAGLLAAAVYGVSITRLLEGYGELVRSHRFLSLTALVILITILGNLLKELGFLERLAQACRGLYGGSRTAVVLLPPLVGLMPMPGGSLLSAPLVNSVLSHGEYEPHFKCAVNYWSRHVVEFTWPIYAGLILTEAIAGMPIARVSLLQLPLSAATLVIGIFYFVRRIKNDSSSQRRLFKPLLGMGAAIWPLALVIVLYGVVKVELTLAVAVSLAILIAAARPSRRCLAESLRQGLSYKLVLLIFGVLSFQMVLEISGGVSSIPKLATEYNFPEALLIFVVCFTIGILTGMVSAYVGLGYSLLAGLLYQPALQPANILLAYLSGYIGVMLSPSHLCLILTNNYFGSDLMKVYRTLALPLILLGIFGYLLYISAYGSLFL